MQLWTSYLLTFRATTISPLHTRLLVRAIMPVFFGNQSINCLYTKKTRVIRPFGDSSVRASGTWIQNQSWNEVYVSEGPQAKTDALYSILKEGMDVHLPTKLIHIHNSDKPWITPYIKNLISERQTAFAQSDSIKWRKLRNKVKREIELAKVNAERVKDLQKTEPRKWHQRIKCMLNSTVSDLHMNIPGIDSNNHKDMANAINTKFVSVSSHIEPLNISTLPAYLPVYPLLCLLGRFTKN